MNIHHPSRRTPGENSAAVRLISHASVTVINGSKDLSMSIYNMQAAMHCWALFICWQVAGRLHTDSYANDSHIMHSALPPYTLPSINTFSVEAGRWKSVLIPAKMQLCIAVIWVSTWCLNLRSQHGKLWKWCELTSRVNFRVVRKLLCSDLISWSW